MNQPFLWLEVYRSERKNGVKKGFTLVEMMVVLLIFSFLFAALLMLLMSSDRSWRLGQSKLIEQQEARKGVDQVVRLLRQSSPAWGVYINGAQDKVQFSSKPVLNADLSVSTTRVIFKPDPADASILIKQEGSTADWIPVAHHIESIKFSGGSCTGCNCDFTNAACSSCTTVDTTCPLVKIEIKTKKDNEFSLISYVSLRNTSAVSVQEPPAQGEF